MNTEEVGMSKWTRQNIGDFLRSMQGRPITVSERAELFMLASAYGDALEQQAEVMGRHLSQTAERGVAVGEVCAPAAGVPDAIREDDPREFSGWSNANVAYRAGWNQCRDAMLSTTPLPAIDIAAVREVIESLTTYADSCSESAPIVINAGSLLYLRDKLARAALQSVRPPAKPDAGVVSDGWKVVPVEPTEAMIDAGTSEHECSQGDPYYSSPQLSDEDARAIYGAMLAAAPSPEVKS